MDLIDVIVGSIFFLLAYFIVTFIVAPILSIFAPFILIGLFVWWVSSGGQQKN